MARIRKGRRAAPGQINTTTPQSVKIDLKAAAAQAAVTVEDGDYDVEIVDADFAVNDRKQTVSLRMTPQVIGSDERIRLQPLCIHDGGAHDMPWYVQRNAKLVTDILTAAAVPVPDSFDDASLFKGLRVGIAIVERQDIRGLPINELAEVYELDAADSVEPLRHGGGDEAS